MSTRDRTALFLRYREDARALHRRRPSSTARKFPHPDDSTDDLSDGNYGDLETARLTGDDDAAEPDWLLSYNDLRGDMAELQSMLDALAALHARHLLPSFGEADTSQLERDIRVSSNRLTQLLHVAEQKVRNLCNPNQRPPPPPPSQQQQQQQEGRRRGSGGSQQQHQQQQNVRTDVEYTIRRNLQKRFATPLQELSQSFRKRQKTYLDKLKEMRESDPQPLAATKASAAAASTNQTSSKSSLTTDHNQSFTNTHSNSDSFPFPRASSSSSFADTSRADGFGGEDSGGFVDNMQMMEVEHASTHARERRQELEQVTTNINELATLVKDLAGLVVDQGTVLDRIDYNVEEVRVKTFAATRELRIADRYQRKRHAMCCIIILSIACGVMAIILIHKWTS